MERYGKGESKGERKRKGKRVSKTGGRSSEDGWWGRWRQEGQIKVEKSHREDGKDRQRGREWEMSTRLVQVTWLPPSNQIPPERSSISLSIKHRYTLTHTNTHTDRQATSKTGVWVREASSINTHNTLSHCLLRSSPLWCSAVMHY